MANFDGKFFTFVFLLSTIALTNGELTSCYYCNTEVDGKACNKPLNITAVSTHICENSTIVANIAGVETMNSQRATNDYVCGTLTYVSQDDNFVTIRDCLPTILNNEEACTQLEKVLNQAGIIDYSCTVCSSDLCNSSPYLHVPFVTFIFSVILVFAYNM